MAAGCLAGCGSGGGQAAETGTKTEQTAEKESGSKEGAVKIAVAGPMTGDNSEYGIGFYNAAELMASQWNEKGGVLGRQIEIVPVSYTHLDVYKRQYHWCSLFIFTSKAFSFRITRFRY